MTDDSVYYRTREEAARLRPKGVAFLEKLEKILPPGQFHIDYATLFVDPTTSEEMGCVAVSLIGYQRAVAPLEFELDGNPYNYVSSLTRWREKDISELDVSEPDPESDSDGAL